MKKILLVLVRFSSLGTRSKVFELLLFFYFLCIIEPISSYNNHSYLGKTVLNLGIIAFEKGNGAIQYIQYKKSYPQPGPALHIDETRV